MADLEISCCECGAAFVFSDAERVFYEGKGLSYPPKRCKACRHAKKSSGSARVPPKGGPEARPLYEIVCAACGARERVPFRPALGREVYCLACHRARQPDPRRVPPGIDVSAI